MIKPSQLAPLLAILASGCASSSKASAAPELTLRSDDRSVVVMADSETFARVVVARGARVALTELRAAGERDVLRGFPLLPRPGESVDHLEQTGMWTAHASIDGDNLWLGPGGARALDHAVRMKDADEASIEMRLEWRGGDDRLLCNESRSYSFRIEGPLRTVDVVHRLTATGSGLVFDDIKDGFFALRLADAFQLTPANEKARAFCSTGARDEDLWGVRARWFAGITALNPTGGVPAEVTVCILDHPDNLQHPPTWHARPYGLVAANPFGRAAFSGNAEESGAYEMDGFETLTLRYRVVVARAALDFNQVDALWADFARTGPRWGE